MRSGPKDGEQLVYAMLEHFCLDVEVREVLGCLDSVDGVDEAVAVR